MVGQPVRQTGRRIDSRPRDVLDRPRRYGRIARQSGRWFISVWERTGWDTDASRGGERVEDRRSDRAARPFKILTRQDHT